MADRLTLKLTSALSSRRTFLRVAFTIPVGAMVAACVVPVIPPVSTSAPGASDVPSADSENDAILEPTLACDDDDEPTIAQTAGPYYTPNSPERNSFLEDGISGTHLLLSGYVLTTGCTPVARALVDFWHCDGAGVYDNSGYRLRGHQFTDEQGRYELTSIVPGIYPGRTRHIHVKVQAPNDPVLTTQLYFPNVADNASDGIFHPSLLVEANEDEKGMNALFNFVLT